MKMAGNKDGIYELDLAHLNIEHVRLLNNIEKEIRGEYNYLIEKLFTAAPNDLDWIVSSVVSRDVIQSDFYQTICYLRLIQKLVEEHKSLHKLVVYSKGLKSVLEKWLSQQGRDIRVVYKSLKLNGIKKHLRGWVRLFYWAFNFISQKTFSHMVSSEVTKDSSKGIILIDIFLAENSFKSGEFQDRYYKEMLELLPPEDLERIYYIPAYYGRMNYLTIYKLIQTSKYKFLLKEKVIGLREYLHALLYPWRIYRKITHYSTGYLFSSFDISPIIRDEIKNNMYNSSSILAILNYYFFKELKRRGVQIKLTIDWFENQVVDKGFNYGIRKYYPEVLTKGYQGYIAPNNYLHITPTSYEMRYKVVPQRVCVISRAIAKEYLQAGIECEVVPALRYAHLWNREYQSKEFNKFNRVLVAFHLEEKGNLEILKLLLETIKEYNLNDLIFWLKLHPAMPQKQRIDFLRQELPSNVMLVEEDFSILLGKVDFMIGAVSSTCVEALASGLPVIIAGSQSGLTFNPIPETIDNELWSVCYTKEEMRVMISRFASSNCEMMQRNQLIASKIKDDYFEPVTIPGINKFLELDN